MMRFKDFQIKILKMGNWFNHTESEKVNETLLRVNNWVEQNEHIVLNIETLLIPNYPETPERTGAAVFKEKGGESANYYYQIFRVWYRLSTSSSQVDVDKLV